MDTDEHGLATETGFIEPANMGLCGNALMAMSLSAWICVHLRFQG